MHYNALIYDHCVILRFFTNNALSSALTKIMENFLFIHYKLIDILFRSDT